MIAILKSHFRRWCLGICLDDGNRGRRGAVLVLVAFLMVAMLGFVAFTIDVGYIAEIKAQLQNVADAGALAGARGLSVCCASQAVTDAKTFMQKNLVAGSAPNVQTGDIVLGTWDTKYSSFTALPAAQQNAANAVKVTCGLSTARGNALRLFFAPVLGIKTTDVSATAIAQSTPVACGAFVGLNSVTISGGSHTDSYDSSKGAYSAGSAGANGNICGNGSISLSGGSTVIHGNAHPGPGLSVSTSGGASVTGSTNALNQALAEPAVDPGKAATVNDNSSIPLSTKKKQPLNASEQFTLSGGDSVDLPPGTYYFSTLTISGGSTLKISGKTIIYVTGKVDVSGGSMANSTQIPSNLQLYPMGTTCVLSGASQTYAVIYGPTADITRSGGSSDFFGSMVGNSLTLSGGGGLHADEAMTGVKSGTKKATMVH